MLCCHVARERHYMYIALAVVMRRLVSTIIGNIYKNVFSVKRILLSLDDYR